MKTNIYLSTGRGVAAITGSDRDWHGEVRLKDHHVQCVAADVNREGLAVDGEEPCGVYVAANTGQLWSSRDEGDSWQAAPALFPPISSVTAFSD